MNYKQNPLTDEQIQQSAPSAFAGQPYTDRSDKYTFVSTIEVIRAMRENGFMPMVAQQSRSRVSGKQFFTKHLIRFRSAKQLTNIGDRAVETIIINSHDGTSSYTGYCGILEFACLNGLVVSAGTVNSFKVRHVGNIVESILKATTDMLREAPKVLEIIREWQQIILTRDEQLAFAQSAHLLKFEEGSNLAQVFKPEALLTPHRYNDNKDDLYSVFNRIQENTIRGGKVRVNPWRQRKIRGVNGIDESTKLNKALWTLAAEMAKLKA